MAQCPYRRQAFECRTYPPAPNVKYCERCLKGQLVDSIELNTGAIMSMSMNRMEEEADGKR